jgi:hypothetical protein
MFGNDQLNWLFSVASKNTHIHTSGRGTSAGIIRSPVIGNKAIKVPVRTQNINRDEVPLTSKHAVNYKKQATLQRFETLQSFCSGQNLLELRRVAMTNPTSTLGANALIKYPNAWPATASTSPTPMNIPNLVPEACSPILCDACVNQE